MSDLQNDIKAGGAVTIRGLAPDLKSRLRVRAAHNARSMEAEARAILEGALSAPEEDATDFGAFARGLFAPLGGVELELPARGPAREPPALATEQDPAVAATTAGEPEKLSAISPEHETKPARGKPTFASPKIGRRRA